MLLEKNLGGSSVYDKFWWFMDCVPIFLPSQASGCRVAPGGSMRGHKNGAQLPSCVAFNGLLTLSESVFSSL